GARLHPHFSPALAINAPALAPSSLPALRQRWQVRQPGLLLVGLVAAASLYLAELPWLQAHGLSALTVAIVAGIVVGKTVYPRLAPSRRRHC
ncbi:putative sulfate exporter family transporter, partial [Klebsiella pneumoniae]|uniref:putative sulfate exporter family transporter n=1 Tax=Klebsiella pneumoniae TaxID=573 RepID=UPI003F1F21B5